MKIYKILRVLVVPVAFTFFGWLCVGVASAAPSEPPLGVFEAVSPDGTITGWAFDADEITQNVMVYFFFDVLPGSSRQSPALSAVASVSRSDVGAHGFAASVPASLKDGNSHIVYAYALDLTDTSGVSDSLLPDSPLSFIIIPTPTPTPTPISTPTVISTPTPSPSVTPTPAPAQSGGGGGGGGGSYILSPTPTPTPASASAPVAIRVSLVNDNGTFYVIENNQRRGITNPGMLQTYGLSFGKARLATEAEKQLVQGPLITPADGSLVKSKEDLTVYLISKQKKFAFTSSKVFLDLGFKFNSVLVVTDPELQSLPNSRNLSDSSEQHLPGSDISMDGIVYWVGRDDMLHAYPSVEIYNSWHIQNDFSTVVPANLADRALPVGGMVGLRAVE